MNESPAAAMQPEHRVADGVYVLGMHRSGTSVVAGVVERLGLDGGPRRSMLSADEFNSDGYWEQRPLVECHDQVLNLLGGWASAPPPPADLARAPSLLDRVRPDMERILDALYQGPWFMKDPRQCLLLDLWTAARGNTQLGVVVFRDPTGVARSLDRRNTYSPELAVALWERYCHELLRSLAGRPCVVLHYEDLTRDPDAEITKLAEGLDRHGRLAESCAGRIPEASSLVRAAGDSRTDHTFPLTSEQRDLVALTRELTGVHDAFRSSVELPALSARGTELLERRRRKLNAIKPLIRSSSSMRARLDQVPAKLRSMRPGSS